MRRAAVLLVAAFAVAAGIALLVRSCRSDAERLSDMVDDARDALVSGRRDEFLSYFADELVYQRHRGRDDLARDADLWIAAPAGRIEVHEREIFTSGTEAKIHLNCDVGAGRQSLGFVDVDMVARKGDDGWKVTTFDWK